MRIFRPALAALFCLPLLGHAYADGPGALIAKGAEARLGRTLHYDPAYVDLDYPMGDPPADRGVCADVVVRALRAVGLDLQALVYEDMRASFEAYPDDWGLSRPDRNIDHRRVRNLETYFARAGYRLAPSADPADYRPGDIIAWDLRAGPGRLAHIGVVSRRRGASGRPLIVHNIGSGTVLEDALFAWPITGRYRIDVSPSAASPSE